MRKFVNNLSWSFVGNFVLAFSQWFVVFLLTKYAEPDLLGMYSAVMIVISPSFMFLSFGLKSQIASDYNQKFKLSTYYLLKLLTTAVSIVVVLSFFVLRDRATILLMAIFILGQKFFDSLSEVNQGKNVRDNKIKEIGQSLMTRGGALAVLSSVIIIFISPVYFPLAMLVASAISFFLFDYYPKSVFSAFRAKWSEVYLVIRKVLPLGVALGIISLNSNLLKIIIEDYLDYKLLGVYTALIYFLAIGGQFYKSIVDGMYPYFVKYYNEKNISRFSSVLLGNLGGLLLVSLAFILVVNFWGEEVLSFVYSPIYGEYSYVFQWIAIASIPIYANAVLGSCLTSIQVYKPQIFGNLINMLVSGVFGVLLIPKFGLLGAVYALIIGHFSQLVFNLIVLLNKIWWLKR